jgi:hypothetical protein
MPVRLPVLVLLLAVCAALPVSADEGMWTFDNPPLQQIKQRYGFEVTQEWLDHVRLAAVRFMDGGSGAFVSPSGLVVTNHHVAMGQLQKMSSPDKDYVADGFYAATRAEEIRCPDLEVNVLVAMENVTERVLAAITEGMNEEQALKARDAERAAIEKQSLAATGLRSDVISLYQGGEYWLYRYRRYTDIRLVMAPEEQAAFFGGDHDNFTYPRYALDVAFFRVYENEQPLVVEHYLRWNPNGPDRDELVFIAGNPASTSRMLTMAQLALLRDRTYPVTLEVIDHTMEVLQAYAARGDEELRQATVYLRGYANSGKARGGMLAALSNPKLMAKRQHAEQELRSRVAADPQLQARYGQAWERIEAVLAEHGERVHQIKLQKRLLDRDAGNLLRIALSLAHHANEIELPDGERLDDYHDSQLEQLRFKLFSPAPIYRDFEELLLAHTLGLLVQHLPPQDRLVQAITALGDPATAAARLVAETRLNDIEVRKQLFAGGRQAVAASDDPLMVLARTLAPLIRANHEWLKKHVESVLTPCGEQIARARFATYGKAVYPDATFTLRLAYGQARGYPMNGTLAPYKTTLFGLYNRAIGFDRSGEFWLPERFWERLDRLDLSTPVNFCSSLDTIGGNSGSPVFNLRAELVGINFDRNIEGLSNTFLHDPERTRNISVHAGYVYEALRKLYDADALAAELVPDTRMTEPKR